MLNRNSKEAYTFSGQWPPQWPNG